MGWIVVSVLAILLAVEFILHGVYGAIMLRSFVRKLAFGVEPDSPDPDAEAVSFPAADGLTLRGSLYRHTASPARGVVVFCPEYGGNHWSAGWYARGLCRAGFDLLAFDCRNQGESDARDNYDPLHWVTEFEVEDVLAAIRYTRSREDLKELPVGLFGISRGGGAALAAAARCRDVRCVAADGAFSTGSLFMHFTLRWAVLYAPQWLLSVLPDWHLKWTITIVQRIAELRRRCRYVCLERLLPRLNGIPTLLVAGARDSYVHTDIPLELSKQMGDGPHEVWIVEGAKHNMARHVDSETYDSKLIALFSTMAVEPLLKSRESRVECPEPE